MCVTCLFEVHEVSLPSTKHVVLRTTIAQEKHAINNLFKRKQVRQTIERCLFNNLVLLRCYDKKDMAKDHELWDMNLRA
jgi:hypothetical protein